MTEKLQGVHWEDIMFELLMNVMKENGFNVD